MLKVSQIQMTLNHLMKVIILYTCVVYELQAFITCTIHVVITRYCGEVHLVSYCKICIEILSYLQNGDMVVINFKVSCVLIESIQPGTNPPTTSCYNH